MTQWKGFQSHLVITRLVLSAGTWCLSCLVCTEDPESNINFGLNQIWSTLDGKVRLFMSCQFFQKKRRQTELKAVGESTGQNLEPLKVGIFLFTQRTTTFFVCSRTTSDSQNICAFSSSSWRRVREGWRLTDRSWSPSCTHGRVMAYSSE